MSATVEQASAIAQILDFILRYLLIPVITAGLSGAVAYKRAEKKFHQKLDHRLFNNMKRPVALLPSKSDGLKAEQRLLKRAEFFKVDLLPADIRSLDEISDDYRLVILRYEESDQFWTAFRTLAARRIPLIIYAKPAEIPIPKLAEIQKTYTRYTLCNTPVRLISDVFAIMSVYPNEEKHDAR